MNSMADGFGAPLAAHLSLRRRVRAGLPDAARMLIAAMVAYALAHLLQLREAHWAVLSALITGRAQAGGTARAGAERLLATIIGAALAAAVAAARAWHVDGALLLFAVLAPLCLLTTVKPAYRTAPIAALIVLSSGLVAGQGPLATAVLRTTEIALGALASIGVALVVFPARAQARAREHAASILHRLAAWLRLLPDADARLTERLREELRAELRELTVLAQTSAWRKRGDGETQRLLRALMALQGDVGFLARAGARKPLHDTLDSCANEFKATLTGIANLADDIGRAATTHAALPSAAQLRAPFKRMATAGGADLQIPMFLLRCVGNALGHVVATLARRPDGQADPPLAPPPEDAPAGA